MTYYQFAGLGIFLVGFLNLYTLVTRFDRWQARLGYTANTRSVRLALALYIFGFIALPMALGLSLIYLLRW